MREQSDGIAPHSSLADDRHRVKLEGPGRLCHLRRIASNRHPGSSPRRSRRARRGILRIRLGSGIRPVSARGRAHATRPARHCGQAAAVPDVGLGAPRAEPDAPPQRGKRGAEARAFDRRAEGLRDRPSPARTTSAWIGPPRSRRWISSRNHRDSSRSSSPRRSDSSEAPGPVELQHAVGVVHLSRGVDAARGCPWPPPGGGLEPFPQARRWPDHPGNSRVELVQQAIGLSPAAGPEGLVDLGRASRDRSGSGGAAARVGDRPTSPAPRPGARGPPRRGIASARIASSDRPARSIACRGRRRPAGRRSPTWPDHPEGQRRSPAASRTPTREPAGRSTVARRSARHARADPQRTPRIEPWPDPGSGRSRPDRGRRSIGVASRRRVRGACGHQGA